MAYIETVERLTHVAVMAMLQAAIKKSEAIGQPQCIVIVDSSGATLAEFRMTGAKFLSLRSARAKALTAASIGASGTNIPESVRLGIAAATGGAVSGLPGGLPILKDGNTLGGIGIGSGSGEQDISVATAALAAIGLEPDPAL